MVATKTKKTELPPISEWGVTKYGVMLQVNPYSIPFFDTGCSLDVEDDEQGNFVGCGIYNPSDNTVYYWNDLERFQAVELSPFVAHNGCTDISKLQKWGFNITPSFLICDTQLMAHILDSSRGKKGYGLKALAADLLGMSYPSYEDIVGKHKVGCQRTAVGCCNRVTLEKQDPALVAEYNAMDCYATYKLYERQKSKATVNVLVDGIADDTQENRYLQNIEKPVSFIFHEMSERGVRVDIPYLRELKEELERQKQPIVDEIKNELGDINLNSTKQLLGALNEKGIKPVLKGKPSTDKRALETLKNQQVVQHLLTFSEIETLLSSFVFPYLIRNEAVVHPNFNQTGTRTGRPSCHRPNLLQIPRRTENGKLVRRMFIPREGMVFGDIDYGQIEPRVLAHLSKDKNLCEMFNQGIDFHTYTQERLNINREKAKVLNLSVGYRATKFSVSSQLKCSYESAQKEIDKWWSMFPELYDYEQTLIYETKKTGYITTLMGRRIKVENLDHNNPFKKEAAERQVINNLAQASAGEIMKLGMIACKKAGIAMLIQVYDELLIEHPESEIEGAMHTAVDCLANVVKLEVPLVVDGGMGRSWTEAKGN